MDIRQKQISLKWWFLHVIRLFLYISAFYKSILSFSPLTSNVAQDSTVFLYGQWGSFIISIYGMIFFKSLEMRSSKAQLYLDILDKVKDVRLIICVFHFVHHSVHLSSSIHPSVIQFVCPFVCLSLSRQGTVQNDKLPNCSLGEGGWIFDISRSDLSPTVLQHIVLRSYRTLFLFRRCPENIAHKSAFNINTSPFPPPPPLLLSLLILLILFLHLYVSCRSLCPRPRQSFEQSQQNKNSTKLDKRLKVKPSQSFFLRL